MNLYKLLGFVNKVKSSRLKMFGLYMLHVTGKRYIAVFLDPVLTCNLRCVMCHFSKGDKPKPSRAIIPEEEITKIANAFFHRALKLQIGCSAEPTMSKNLPNLIALAKSKGVPYVSVTTNGNLFTKESLEACLKAGLNEITYSIHGVTKEVYERFMLNADYERFCEVVRWTSDLKEKYPVKIRLNYTMNEDNFDDLASFFEVFGQIKVDVLQLRPNNAYQYAIYTNDNHERLIEDYDKVIGKIRQEAASRNVICMAPTKAQLLKKDGENDNTVILSPIQCRINPEFCWRQDFDLETETFESYCKRKHRARKLLEMALKKPKKYNRNKQNLNYTIQ